MRWCPDFEFRGAQGCNCRGVRQTPATPRMPRNFDSRFVCLSKQRLIAQPCGVFSQKVCSTADSVELSFPADAGNYTAPHSESSPMCRMRLCSPRSTRRGNRGSSSTANHCLPPCLPILGDSEQIADVSRAGADARAMLVAAAMLLHYVYMEI